MAKFANYTVSTFQLIFVLMLQESESWKTTADEK